MRYDEMGPWEREIKEHGLPEDLFPEWYQRMNQERLARAMADEPVEDEDGTDWAELLES
jgi:hypothetical protein